MMTTPEPVEIDRKLWDELRRIDSEKRNIQTIMDQFIANCEGRLHHANEKAGEVWRKIRDQHKIDLTNIHWAPDVEKPQIVAIQMKLGPARSNDA